MCVQKHRPQRTCSCQAYLVNLCGSDVLAPAAHACAISQLLLVQAQDTVSKLVSWFSAGYLRIAEKDPCTGRCPTQTTCKLATLGLVFCTCKLLMGISNLSQRWTDPSLSSKPYSAKNYVPNSWCDWLGPRSQHGHRYLQREASTSL